MKSLLFAFSILAVLIFTNSGHAALIEGHFYAKTCGENVISSQLQPIDRSSGERIAVTQVCHGDLLTAGVPVETLRFNLVSSTGETSEFDFTVTDKALIQRGHALNRSTVRDFLISATHPQVGEIQFKARYVDDRIYAIQSAQPNANTTLIIQVNAMDDMFNIMSVPDQNGSVLR